MAKYSKDDIARAEESLRDLFKPGDTVYLVLRDRSRSGMRRTIGVLAAQYHGNLRHDGSTAPEVDFFHPNWAAAVILGWGFAKSGTDGVIVNGCGMDMGFHLVDCLSRALYGRGDALKYRWL